MSDLKLLQHISRLGNNHYLERYIMFTRYSAPGSDEP